MTEFTVQSSGARLAGSEAGEGEPIVLLHPGVGDRRIWRDTLPALAEAGYRALAYDRRGYGETEAPAAGFSEIDDLAAVLDARQVERAVLVGNSMGGGLAIDFALAYPGRVAGLVLVAPAISGLPDPETMPEAVMPAIMAMIKTRQSGDIDAAAQADAHAWLDGPLSQEGRVAGEKRQLFLDMDRIALGKARIAEQANPPRPAVDRLGQIGVPVLVIVGRLDFPNALDTRDLLLRSIPQARAVTLAGVAHLPSLERPDLFNAALLDFLGED